MKRMTKVGMIFYNFFAIVLMMVGFSLAIITMLPDDASKLNLIGYYSQCSFAPISSIILLSLGAVGLFLLIRFVTSRKRRKI